jgi:hypothetical protein
METASKLRVFVAWIVTAFTLGFVVFIGCTLSR